MHALQLVRPGRLAWQSASVPVQAPGEVLVRVRYAGVCGTDLHAFAGRQPFLSYPRRLGHELSVQTVDLVPDNACAVNPYLHCSRCQPCRAGSTNCCEGLEVLGVHRDGGWAPLLSVPRTHLYPSKTLPAKVLALVEPLVVSYHAVRRARIQAGEPVVVVGMGPIGLGVALFARLMGADLHVCEARLDRRQASRAILDRDEVLSPGPTLERALRRVCGGDLPQVVFDATGSKAAMHVSFSLAAHGGRCVFVGHYPGEYSFYEPDFHRRELTLLASRNGQHQDFLSVITALEDGTVDVSGLVTHQYKPDQMPAVLPDLADTPGLIKALIAFS